ncbi:PLP-dependent aminotransferase family protein [Oxalobacteraceae bacterium OM1]|nr:PLP-dependent aminotransferase family protein [Oxalobacteraceae bacterium OM1]
MKRYERLAAEIAGYIDSGAMKPGDRLPSVRQICVSRGVSASTVFKAYYLLEARGIIRARERSGYYVTSGPEPRAARGLAVPLPNAVKTGDVGDLPFKVIESSRLRDIVPFGSAFPSPLLFPLARLGRAMVNVSQHVDPWRSVTDMSPGNAELRQHIALRYVADGIHVHPDDLVITNGALDALDLCLQAVTKPGDCVAVESPAFYGALQALKRHGLRAVEVPTHPSEGIDVKALERIVAIHRPTACWIMPNFQNPLGSSMPDAKKQALVALLADKGIPLIEDDVYGELYFGRQRPLPAKAFDRHGLVLHCSSFSKCLAPGYRIGWAAPGRYLQDVIRLKLGSSLGTSVPVQAALAEYLNRSGFDKHLRQLRQTLLANRDTMLAAIARHLPAGTVVLRPEGGYFLWVQLPEGIDAIALHRRALAAGVSIAPGPIFCPHHGFRHCIRLNYGHPWTPRAEAAMETLGQLIAAGLTGDVDHIAA